MKELLEQIQQLIQSTNGDSAVIEAILHQKTLRPFSRETALLAYFVSIGELSYETYTRLSEAYAERNRYLDLFEMAPRTYGQTWGEEHIRSLFPQFERATKETLATIYPGFDGEFDLWLDGIRIEVKACRANSTARGGSLANRAYLHEQAKANGFHYHFQQIKPSCCDVFIWIGTCRDELLYWVLSGEEVVQTGKLGPQHRNEHTGKANVPVFEGQVFMTEEELAPFRVEEADILEAVRKKAQK